MVRQVFFGEFNTRWEGLKDITTPFARLPFVVLLLALMFTGIWPATLTQTISVSTIPLIESIEEHH
jgi:NADH:ubiquinone oxidoreductase subunit 4 (subunit M)